ncbi:Uncharacterised protein [uncultured archaeon]|nr:Uncharacterised protein [uncultured archaeon]
MKVRFILVIIFILLAVFLFTYKQSSKNQVTINKTKIITDEIFKLQSTAYERSLTVKDLTNLSILIQDNDKMVGEFNELKWMINHNYQTHAIHSLQSIYDIVTNTTTLCPADPLSHAAIYLKFNETQMAQDSINEATEQLSPWEEKVRNLKSQTPGVYPNFEEILSVMKREITEMNAANYSGVEVDGNYVESNSYC